MTVVVLGVVVVAEEEDDDDEEEEDGDDDDDYDVGCKKCVGSAVAFLFFTIGMLQCMDAFGNQLRSSTLTVLPESSGTKNTYNNPSESYPRCHNACHIRKVTKEMIARSTSFDVYHQQQAY